jgi:enoyl-CoA hydratase/carnithine racemase
MENPVLFEKRNDIGWVQFNRPEKLNAINMDLLKGLEEAVALCEEDETVKVVVLRGSEKAFVAGADIKDMATAGIRRAAQLTDITMRVQERLADIPKPTIAAISGYALGGGCELALCCDFRIVADNAVLGLPEITLGIIPGGGGTQRLPRLVGLAAATEMVMLGETINAERAERIGLANKVVPLARLMEEVETFAGKLKQKPSVALRAAKIAVRKGLNCSLKEGLQMEQNLFCMLFGTKDQKEGMAAFLARRKPSFVGE